MPYTQDNRLIRIDTPLGKDALLLQSFSGEEGISQLFRFHLDLLSENSSIDFKAIIGQRVTIGIQLADGTPRYWNGFVSRFAQTGGDAELNEYQAEVVPWLWFLTRTADCRIFQNLTVPDIIQKIFKDLGFTDVRNALQGSFQPRDYCVQYRETDFNFVSRLMEQYGIFYFFEQGKDKHTLVLANSPAVHQPCPHQATVVYESVSGQIEEQDAVESWHVEQELRPGKYALTDYNFETPSTKLEVGVASIVNVGGNSKFEIYDYPGEYLKKADGEGLVRIRMEEEEAPHCVVTAAGNCRAFTSGYGFTLTEHPRQDMNRRYLLTHVQHAASVGASYRSGESGVATYSNRFICVPGDVTFRPPRITPRPIVQGVQTAVVVGKQGEEIWVDKYGRVKVQFHWDREGKRNENSSCWIRVSQPWAGKGFGGMVVPRIGQEVIVEFLEGDPDQPIINGRVYNGEQLPYGSKAGQPELQRIQDKRSLVATLTKAAIAHASAPTGGGGGAPASAAGPIIAAVAAAVAQALIAPKLFKMGKAFVKGMANPAQGVVDAAMMTTIKSNSLGGSGGSSELTLNDTPGAESMFLKAERDMITSVNSDHTTTVAGDVVLDIAGVRHTMINGKDTLNVGKAHEVTVGGRYHLAVSKSAIIKIKGLQQHSVTGNYQLTLGRNAAVTVKGDTTTNIAGKASTEVGKDSSVRVGGNQTVEIKGDAKLTIDKTETVEVKDKITIKGNATIEVSAVDEMVLKCGGASITLKKSGDVEVKGTNIKLEATAKLEGKGMQVASEATATNTIKGAIVKIN